MIAAAHRPLLVLSAATLVALTAACGSGGSPTSDRPNTGTGTASANGDLQTITLTTGNDYRFHPSTIVVHPGRVRIVLDNTATSGPPHNLSVIGFPGDFVPLTGAGSKQAATFTAPAPGTYKFECTIHVEQGQTGTLVVKAGA